MWQWVELYEHHDKYKLVGRLRPDAPEPTDETSATESSDEMTEEEWCASAELVSALSNGRASEAQTGIMGA